MTVNILCTLERHGHEHVSKVRLTKRDMVQGKLSSAEQRMGKEEGGLARHSVECTGNIDWDGAKIVKLFETSF